MYGDQRSSKSSRHNSEHVFISWAGFMCDGSLTVHFMRTPICLQDIHKDLASGQEAEGVEPVSVAGRVMNKRVMGKLAFLTLRDDKGQIQVSHTYAWYVCA